MAAIGLALRHLNSTQSHWRRHFLLVFTLFEKCQSDVADNVISDVVVGVYVHVKCGDFRSNGSPDIQGADFVSNEHD